MFVRDRRIFFAAKIFTSGGFSLEMQLMQNRERMQALNVNLHQC